MNIVITSSFQRSKNCGGLYIVSKSFDSLTRLFCCFANRDTTLGLIGKFSVCTGKTVHTGKNNGKNVDKSK